MAHSIPSRKGLLGETAVMYLLLLSIGVSTTIIGTALTLLIDEFGVPIARGGVFASAQNVGCFLGILLSGALLDRFDKRILVLVSFAVFALSNFLTAWTGGFAAFVAVVFAAGAVFKFSDAALNTRIADMHAANKGVFINLLHCSYGIGSFLGPLLTGLLLNRGYSWRTAYSALGWFCLALALVYFLIVRGKIGSSAGAAAYAPVRMRTLLNARILILWLVLVLYAGHQMGINSWLPAYQTVELGIEPAPAGFGVSAFWFGLILSRLFCSMLLRYVGERTLLIVGCALGGLSLIAGALSGDHLVIMIGSGAAGLFGGAANPITLTVGYSLHPEAKGKVSMLLFLAITLGGAFFPWLMGVVGSHAGLTWAILMCGALPVCSGLLALCLPKGGLRAQTHDKLNERIKQP